VPPEFAADYPVREYRPGPSLLPYGWLPQLQLLPGAPFRLAASTRLFGQDASGDHSYSLEAGHDARQAGGWTRFRYDYRSVDVFDLFQRPQPVGFGLQFGTWPHVPHGSGIAWRATGAMADLRVRYPVAGWSTLARVRAGALHLPPAAGLQPDARLDVVASRRRSDLWGYAVRGQALALHALWSADPSGGRPAAWLEANAVLPATGTVTSTTELSVTAGFRPPTKVPVAMGEWSLRATVTARDSARVGWRYADGIVALERVSLEGRVHGWYDGSPRAAADLSLWGDAMLRYGAPLSLGVTVGYSGAWWYALGLRTPL
jgi:hypothetical protein